MENVSTHECLSTQCTFLFFRYSMQITLSTLYTTTTYWLILDLIMFQVLCSCARKCNAPPLKVKASNGKRRMRNVSLLPFFYLLAKRSRGLCHFHVSWIWLNYLNIWNNFPTKGLAWWNVTKLIITCISWLCFTLCSAFPKSRQLIVAAYCTMQYCWKQRNWWVWKYPIPRMNAKKHGYVKTSVSLA